LISGSFSNQEVFSKGPFLIDPLSVTSEACVLRNSKYLGKRILVTALSPDGFAFNESDRQGSRGYGDGLFFQGAQVHLHTAHVLIETRHVFELLEDEVGIKFPIDPRQQIQSS
jgi:hypothetical protein